MDIQAWLLPISAESPCGPNPRAGAVAPDFTQLTTDRKRLIEAARRPKGDPLPLPEAGGREPTWKGVATAAEKLLGRCRDLEVTAYLTESWTRLHQWKGLTAGLTLMGTLLDRFWEAVHPGIDSEGDDGGIREGIRAKWVNWIAVNQDFQDALGTIQIDKGEDGSPLTIRRYLESRMLSGTYSRDQAEYQRLLESGLTSPDAWRSAMTRMGAPVREQQVEAVRLCLNAVASLEAACGSRFKEAQCDLSPLRDLLQGLERELQLIGTTSTSSSPGLGNDPASNQQSTGGPAVGTLQSRQDVIRALADIARYLRATEPHSPVSHMIDRCVHWLGLGFEDLMTDLIRNDETVINVREVLGIKKPEKKE